MAEMLGRETGVCGGRAGSMNVVDLKHGLVGCFGIVGGSIAAATGAALSAQAPGRRRGRLLRRRRHQPGYFHECLNFAKVFTCRPSSCARTTSTASSRRCSAVTAGADIAARAAAYGMPARLVDGNDLWAVREAAARGRRPRPRAATGPTLLECQTYRHYGHSKSDPAKYRPEGELERWRERDPLDVARERLRRRRRRRAGRRRPRSAIARRARAAIEAALRRAVPRPRRRQATEFAS